MSWFTQNIRDPIESIAPTALGYMYGGAAGGALAGQLAKPFEAKSAQTSDIQKAADIADIGLGAYGAYQGITGTGNAFKPYWDQGGGGATAAGAKYFGPTEAGGFRGQLTPTGVDTSIAPTAPAATTPSTSILGTMGKYATPLAMGLSAVSSMGRKPTDYTPQLQALAAPAQAAGATLLNSYSAGKLTPADQYQIDSWEKNQIAQIKDYYARSGQADSTMSQSQIGNIQAQAQSMRSQALNSMLTSGLNAIGLAAGPVTTAIQTQIAQDQQMQQAQSQLFQTLAMFGAQYAQG